MKTKWFLVTALAAIFPVAGVSTSKAAHPSVAVEVTAVAEFEGPLVAHGVWIETTYGRCWRPSGVSIHWRPYCDGYWVWTDCGWYWVSDEPWAWACYHYGRWAHHSRHGWIWVPDVVWGPSWVCWRSGGGYVGWAPLPPRVHFHGDVIDASFADAHPSFYVFVEVHRFHGRHHPRSVFINDVKIVNKTKNVTKIKRVEKTVINEGPPLAEIEEKSKQKVKTLSIKEAQDQTPVPATIQKSTTKEKAETKEIEKERRRDKEIERAPVEKPERDEIERKQKPKEVERPPADGKDTEKEIEPKPKDDRPDDTRKPKDRGKRIPPGKEKNERPAKTEPPPPGEAPPAPQEAPGNPPQPNRKD